MDDAVSFREEDLIDPFEWHPLRGIESPYLQAEACVSEDG